VYRRVYGRYDKCICQPGEQAGGCYLSSQERIDGLVKKLETSSVSDAKTLGTTYTTIGGKMIVVQIRLTNKP